ncbi:hypothetical protein C8P64_3278 [Christiangramia gaetbulicola]|uniref:Uncharacterized protein n=2 Tax=Christiangramia gaetbulicola TaxID=703340 RepID=A0A2T6ACE4_9FLAO|nr:hypothetical protein C8P64_3278 [Christiangramia gaetbulicola]
MAVIGLLFYSCNKDESVPNEPEISQDIAVLSFGPVLNEMVNRAAVRQQIDDLPECSDATPAFAQLSLTYGESDTPIDLVVEILSDENGLFTAYDEELEIPIPSGSTTVSVTLTDFLVLSDNGGIPGDVIWAAPKMDSEYAVFVETPLPLTWDLRAGSKTYVDVPVLCFDDRQVNLYGYLFFDITPKELSTLCFFANYCTESGRHYTANYSLDLYLGTSSLGTPLYLDQTPETGNDGQFYADPVCLTVPAPEDGIDASEPYLYYEITLTDWPDNYGTAGNYIEAGTLSWLQVQELLNPDGTTAEYKHIYLNCEESNDDGEDTYVTVTVDTRNITADNLNETVFFTDNRSSTASNSAVPENHIALVNPNRRIFWSGTTLESDTGETIIITEVYRKEEGGEMILTRTYTEPDLEGFLIGDVRSDYIEGFEFYNLVFTIYGETERTFTIDPKIKMQPN